MKFRTLPTALLGLASLASAQVGGPLKAALAAPELARFKLAATC
ncbi:hypothetical protein [Deinococcus sp.]